MRAASSTQVNNQEMEIAPTESYVVQEVKSVAKLEYFFGSDTMKTLAQVSIEKEWFALEDCVAILEDIRFKKPNKTRAPGAWGTADPEVYAAFGAYQHGGFSGITKATRRYDHLVKYLVKFIKRHAGTADPITSIVGGQEYGCRDAQRQIQYSWKKKHCDFLGRLHGWRSLG